MKVPNKVLNIIYAEFSKLPTTPDTEAVLLWAAAGKTKRESMQAEKAKTEKV